MNRLFEFLCVSAAFVGDVLAPHVPRTVNLALETSLFDYRNLKSIAEARKLLDNLERAISPPKSPRSGDNYLTNFLSELAETLMKFDEDKLNQFFIILELEMKLHFYKGSIFREIVYDSNLLAYFRKKLKEWADTDPRKMRAIIRKYMLIDRHKNTPLNRLGSFLNAYYKDEQDGKMREIMEKLRIIDNDDDLGRIIRDGVNDLVIQHYDKMNYTTRAKLADEINKVQVKKDFSKIGESNIDEDIKLSIRKFIKDISDISNSDDINKLHKESKDTLVNDKNAAVVGNTGINADKLKEKDINSTDRPKNDK